MDSIIKNIYNKLKSNIEIAILILFIIFIKIFFLVQKTHNLFWDESVYVGISKSFYSFGEIGLYENIRPPVLSLFISMIDLIINNKLLSAEIVITAFTIGCMIMTYLIGKKLFNKYVGIISAALLFIIPVFFLYSNRIMTEIPALFFSLLSIYFAIEKKYVLSGVFSGITFITRFPLGLIVPIINLIIIYKPVMKKKRKENTKIKDFWSLLLATYSKTIKELLKLKYDLLKYNISFAIIFIGFLIYSKIVNGSFIKPLLLASEHQSTLIGNHLGIDYITFYPRMIIMASLVLLLPIYIVASKNLKENKNLFYIVIPFIVFLSYFFIIPHKQDRFIIIILPYLTILTAYTIYEIFSMAEDKRYKIIIVSLFLITIIQPIALCIEQVNIYPTEKLVGHDDYFGFLNKLDSNLKILTSDPLPTAYTNHKYIPFYQDTKIGLKVIKDNIDSADLIIYNPSAFPWNDEKSIKEKEDMLNIIRTRSKLINNVTYNGEIKEIYLIEK